MRLAATATLEAVLANISDARLAALIVAIVRNGAEAPATASTTASSRRRGGWPKGVPRREQAPFAAAAAAEREAERLARNQYQRDRYAHRKQSAQPAAAGGNGAAPIASPADDPATAAQQARPVAGPADAVTAAEAPRARSRRIEAQRKRRDREAGKKGNGTAGGNGAGDNPAEALWQHAEVLAPGKAWKIVAKEFHLNEALVLDAYRRCAVPPGMGEKAVSHFLNLPAS